VTFRKRLFDLAWVAFLLVPLVSIGLVVALAILLRDGRPIFHVAPRMRSPTETFHLVKFRTMTPSPADRGVSGRDKAHRITPLGALLRRTRLDEIPQIWNIARGEMSFVGPRPPLPQYVAMFPDLYRAVLRVPPGVTGLATLAFKDHEAALLARCETAEETEAVYVTRCVPRKAALDLLYQRNASICWDTLLMFATVFPGIPYRLRRADAHVGAGQGIETGKV
jgi:lipopolysaccharide/colanic/teichoic acid biosynthesis glycosyltransferase